MPLTITPVFLNAQARGLLCAHLLRLDPGSRRRRFGCGIGDSGIGAYCAGWEPCMAFAVVDGEGLWRGVVEMVQTGPRQAELALSIEAPWRGQGWGARLLSAATRWGRTHGIDHVVATIATHNPEMRALVPKTGCAWSHEQGGFSQARWSTRMDDGLASKANLAQA